MYEHWRRLVKNIGGANPKKKPKLVLEVYH